MIANILSFFQLPIVQFFIPVLLIVAFVSAFGRCLR